MDNLVDFFGSIALILGVASYAVRQDRILRLLNLVCCMAWLVHFFLMTDYSAAIMLVLAIVMIGSAALGHHKICKAAWWMNVCLVPVFVLSSFFGLASWRSLLPVMGGLFINTAVSFFQGHRLTCVVALGEAVWFVNALMIGSTYAAISAVLGVAALLFRTVRILRKTCAVAPAAPLMKQVGATG